MATGSVKRVERTNGTVVWYVRYDEGGSGGRRGQRRRTFATKREAEDFLARHRADLTAPAPIDRRLTLREFLVEQWLPSYAARYRASSFIKRDADVRVHLVPNLGHIRLAALSPVAVQAFYTQLAQSRKPRTVANVAATLNAALNQAVAWDILPRNPAKGAKPPPVPRRRATVLTPEQYRAFLAAEDDADWRCLWDVLAHTGMREAECCALVWGDVDYTAGTIRVERTLTRAPGVGPRGGKTVWTVGPVKAGDGRVVSVTSALLALVQRMQQRQEGLAIAGQEDGLVVSGRDVLQNMQHVAPLSNGVVDGGRIFPLTPSSVMGRRAIIAKRAGLPHSRVHDLRHAHVTAGLIAGVPMKVMSERVGHSSIAITADLYAHVTRELDRSAAEAIGGVLLGELVLDDGAGRPSAVHADEVRGDDDAAPAVDA